MDADINQTVGDNAVKQNRAVFETQTPVSDQYGHITHADHSPHQSKVIGGHIGKQPQRQTEYEIKQQQVTQAVTQPEIAPETDATVISRH